MSIQTDAMVLYELVCFGISDSPSRFQALAVKRQYEAVHGDHTCTVKRKPGGWSLQRLLQVKVAPQYERHNT